MFSPQLVWLIAVLGISLGSVSFSVQARDSLQILPTRLVLDGETSADLTLLNKGDESGNYRILLRNIRASDDGKFEEATEAMDDELFADKFIRYSPRSITVEENSNQKVRLVVRKPRNLPPGEYRTHMVFQSLPKEVASTVESSQDVRVSVDPIIEISIPIIIRNGELDASVSLGDLEITEDNNLNVQIQRQGNRSLYGSVEAVIDSGSAKGIQAGFAKGISVYVPNAVRNFLLPLTLPNGFDKSRDKLLVRFSEDPSYGGDKSAELTLNP